MTKVLLTAVQVAKIFQVSKSHIYIMAKKGKLPSVQFGRVIRFDGDEIAAFIQAHMTFTTGERSSHG
ncbi:MAG: helix-turn-helix domain-containing protein [Deltaproteobacteria bacterium]|nr:helix-turn-helix domain-containing protein [Deltaproteobacteria bacterium]